MIRNIEWSDIHAITTIYNYYIENTIITFEEERITPEDMAGRVESISREYPWIVFEENGTVVGYAYASRFRARASYRHSTETTIYLDKDRLGKGFGYRLYKELLDRVKKGEFRVAYAAVALPNPGSVRLHEKLEFRKVGHFTDVGLKFGNWIDVGYWELPLQR